MLVTAAMIKSLEDSVELGPEVSENAVCTANELGRTVRRPFVASASGLGSSAGRLESRSGWGHTIRA